MHSGPESTRHTADVTVSKHDELDTYLPAFRATVTEAKAGSVMCAYNSINGEPGCANQFLLQDQLRGKWDFQGYVVSDCGAVVDIYRNHHYKPTQPEASAISLQRGMDNECVDGGFLVKDDSDYKAYRRCRANRASSKRAKSTRRWCVSTPRACVSACSIRRRLVPYSKIDENELNSPANRQLAHEIANESMVLLKNDGILPLKTSGMKIAVIGPLANQTKVLLGNYNGSPTYTVSILDGLLKEFSGDTITYVSGTQFLGHDAAPVPASALTVDGKPGIKVSFAKLDMSNINNPEAMKPVATRIESTLDAGAQPIPPEAASVHPLVIRYEGTITAPETGDYNLGMKASGFFRVQLDGKSVTSSYGGDPYDPRLGSVHLEAGKPAALKVDYAPNENGKPDGRACLVKDRSQSRSQRPSKQPKMLMSSSRFSASPANSKAKRCR